MKSSLVKLMIVLSLVFCTSCVKHSDDFCKLVKYVEVNGNLVKIDEMNCGCFPKQLDSGQTVEFNGKTYNVINKYECN